MGQFSETDHQR